VLIANVLTGLSTTSSVTVTVNQTAGTFGVTPSSLTIAPLTTAQFSGGILDQFGNPLVNQSAITWSVLSGGGSINSLGVYTAGASAGTATIRASSGNNTASSTVTIASTIAWYKADSTTGSTLVDSSGSNSNAALTGAYSWGTGVGANDITFSGGYATLPTGIVSSLTNFTIAAWINVTSLSSWERIFDFGTGTSGYMFLSPDNGSTNTLRFSITTNGYSNEQQLNGPAISLGVWTHVAVTLAGTVGTLYVNGVAVTSNPAMTLNPSSLGVTTQNYLGKSQFSGDPAYSGAIDDFRIYNQALSPQQVLELAAPTVLVPAAVSTSTVTGTTVNLSVTAIDVTAGQPSLIYNWSVLGTPPAAVTFTANGTNAGQNTSAIFTSAGTYGLQVSIVNPTAGVVTTSSVTVVVTQTITSISVTPANASISDGQTNPFAAVALDQFGMPLSAQPTFTWTVTGAGSINTTGLYAAPASGPATDTVRASAGGVTGSATANVTLSVILGTTGNDTIRLVRSGANLLIYLNSATPTYNVSYGSLAALSIIGNGGIDSVNMDFSVGTSPVPAGGVFLNGSGGIMSVIAIGTTGADTASVGSTSLIFDASTINYANASSIVINGNGGADTLLQTAQPANHATLQFNANTSGGTSTLDTLNVSGGVYSFAAPATGGGFQPISLASLVVGSGASVLFASGATATDRSVVELGSLSLSTAGFLDLGSNDLILHNSSAAAALQSLAGIVTALQSGYNSAGGGNWNGPGLSSSAAAGDSTHLTTLGVMLNSTLGSFDLQTVSNTDVIVKYTYYGDVNLDGRVDGSDYSRIDNGIITHATGWNNGDLNYDGVVNGSDYTLIDNAFNRQTMARPSAMLARATTPSTYFSSVPIGSSFTQTSITTSAWSELNGDDLLHHKRVKIF
jgi:hypothetical protein